LNVDVLSAVLIRCFRAPHEYGDKLIAFSNRRLDLINITHSLARDDLQPDHCFTKFFERNSHFCAAGSAGSGRAGDREE
jgi:hypothetical protein